MKDKNLDYADNILRNFLRVEQKSQINYLDSFPFNLYVVTPR